MLKLTKFIIGFSLAVGLVAAAFVLPLRQWTLLLVEWIRGRGGIGAAVFAVTYVAATVLLFPASLLTLAAGFLYGPFWGMLLVSPTSVLASTIAFLLGRSVARDWIKRRIEENPRFAAVDSAVGENGFKVIFLLRLSPVFPFTLLNYALGLTRVRLRDFVLASFLGMLPGTFMYVYFGSSVANAAAFAGGRPAGGPWQQVLFWGGLVATMLVVALVTRAARQALDRSLHQPSAATASEPAGVRS